MTAQAGSSIGPILLDNAVRDLWKQFQAHTIIGKVLADGGRTGIWVTFARESNPDPRMHALAGELTAEKKHEKEKFAGEKLDRTIRHRPEHLASSQSRNADEKQFSGCALGVRYYCSTSGMWPDSLDELFSVLVLVRLGDLTLKAARALLKKLKNEYCEAFNDFQH